MKKLMLVGITLSAIMGLFGNNGVQAQEVRILVPGVVHNVSPRPTDWTMGYNAVFVGSRLPQFDRLTYLKRLSNHVSQVRREFGKTGLNGYMVYTNGDGEIAYINWVSKDAMTETFASDIGKAIMGDAASFMHTDAFKDVSVDQLFKLFPTR